MSFVHHTLRRLRHPRSSSTIAVGDRRPPSRIARAIRTLVVASAFVASSGAAAPASVDAAGCLRIVDARFDASGDDAANLNGEWVRVSNACSGTVSLSGWRVRDRAGITYRYPSTARLAGGRAAYLHTGRGRNSTSRYYWGRRAVVWGNDSSERAYLVRPDGRTASTWPRSTGSGAATAWAVPFGSRPASGPIALYDCRDVVIQNLTIRDTPAGSPAIRLVRCSNVTIRAVDLINVPGGIVASDSTNIRVIDVRYQNITGPAARTGANVGNFVQFDGVVGGLIDHNKGRGGDTEDVISLHRSSDIIVEDNHFEGTNWSSRSSSGIALADGGGSNNIARRNILVNVGAVGIFVAAGTNHRIEGNTILGEARPGANVGMYVWNQSSGASCSGHSVIGNRVSFRKADGSLSAWWNGRNCGSITMSGNAFAATLRISSLRVSL